MGRAPWSRGCRSPAPAPQRSSRVVPPYGLRSPRAPWSVIPFSSQRVGGCGIAPMGKTQHLVVGLGASAGGLDAFKAFFSHMPPTSGMAFILVQHLSPDHKSMLVELVRTSTSMPVEEATDGARVQPDHVYVMPP